MAHSIKMVLKNKPRSDGTFPIVLQFIQNGKSNIISTGVNCKAENWDGFQLKKGHPNHEKQNLVLIQKKTKALKIVDDFVIEESDFNFQSFKEKYNNDTATKTSVFEHFQDLIAILKDSGRTGSERSYKDTRNSFFNFHQDRSLLFSRIDVALLERYESYLRCRGNIDSGVAFKMRTLRAVFNSARKQGLVKKEYYPFTDYKISKLKGRNIKRALTRSNIKQMIDLNIDDRPDLIDSKNYLVFSYFTRGMNWIDLMKLKKTDIGTDRFTYIRSKTKGLFTIKMLPIVKSILEYYIPKSKTKYVFPILLNDNMTPGQIENRKHKTLSRYNADLNEIAKLAGIEQRVTSYVIRHSFATHLKYLGVSTDVISQSMGHTNISITSNYLKDFEDETVDNANEKLLNF